MIFHPDYRRYFSEEFEARTVRNPSYSMRAFARDLEIAVSTLTEILQGRYGLSRERAITVGRKLGLSSEQCAHLADLMTMKNARGRLERRQAAARVKERVERGASPQTLDAFRAVTDWYHLAIYELIETKGARFDIAWIANRLDLSDTVVSEAIDRLKRLGLIESKGRALRQKQSFSALTPEVPAESLRKFHRQILERAILALDFQDQEERAISSSVFSISGEDLPAAKAELERFRREFQERFAKRDGKADDVYCFGTQLFSASVRKN